MHVFVTETRTFDCDISPAEIAETSQGDLLVVDYAINTVNNVRSRHNGIEKLLPVAIGWHHTHRVVPN